MLLKWTQDRTPSILFWKSNPYFAGKLTKLVCLHTSLSLSTPNRLLSSIPFSVVPACNPIIACRSRLLLSPHYNPRPTHLYGNNSYPSAAKLWRVFYLASTTIHRPTNIEKTTSLGCCKKARLTQSRKFFIVSRTQLSGKFLLFLCQLVYGSFFAAIFPLTNTATVLAKETLCALLFLRVKWFHGGH